MIFGNKRLVNCVRFLRYGIYPVFLTQQKVQMFDLYRVSPTLCFELPRYLALSRLSQCGQEKGVNFS